MEHSSLNHLNLCPQNICISININMYTNILIDEENLMDILEIIKLRREPIIVILDPISLSKYIDRLLYNENIIVIY